MSEFHKDRELEHMFELQGNNRSGCPDHTADIWDKRTFPHGPLNMPVCLQRRAGR